MSRPFTFALVPLTCLKTLVAFALLGCTPAASIRSQQEERRPELRVGEAALLAQYPHLVKREDQVLKLWPGQTGTLALDDRSCNDSTVDDCVTYQFDAVFEGGDIVGVNESYYEGGSYFLYSVEGESIEVGERPIAAPDNRHLFSAASSDSHPPDTGVSLIAVAGPKMSLVRRVFPSSLTQYESMRWLGPHCAGFIASAVDADGNYGDQPRGTWYLIEDGPEWRLSQEASSECQGR